MNFEILAYDPTPLGLLCLRRRELLSQPETIVTEFTLNHEFLMSSLYTDSERELARIAAEFHGGENLKVLVGGLGLGYTAAEALQCNSVQEVRVCELLPEVIGWVSDGLIPLSETLSNEPRLSIESGDIYASLAELPDELFDIILIDVDHSPDERLENDSQQFYTTDGLAAAKRHLNSGGVLGVWSYAESTPFADALHRVFSDVIIRPVTFDNQLVDERHTDWLFFAKN